MYNKIIQKIKKQNICILGFGKEGVSTYKFIRRHLPNKKITIIDKNQVLNPILTDDINIEIISGDNYLNNLEKYDLIIKTPGISFKNIDTTLFKDKITSQLELILEVFKNNIIGITGTKGKSTTCSLMNKILIDNEIDSYLLGNIGNPILDDVEKFNSDTYLVIEMSAHQLEYVKFSPRISVVLNLFEDHLDHAGTLEHYHESKMNIFKYQDSNDYAIYSLDNEYTINQMNKNNYNSNFYKVTLTNNADKDIIHLNGDNIILNNEILYNKNSNRNLLGEHNLSNIMFCLVISKILKLDMNKVISSINNFIPLEHRLEKVGIYNDIVFYNDSISTIPMATINAIKSLKDVDTLIFGGMDRGIDYTDLIEFLSSCDVNNLICMPSTGYKIGKEIEKINKYKNIYYIEKLEDAVKKSKEITKKGKICLMSPAASSYEYFKNFEEKGKKFKEYVKNN